MVERKIEKSVHDTADSSMRSQLLMPIMEGNTLESNDVTEFLKCRLSLLREWTSRQPSIQLS